MSRDYKSDSFQEGVLLGYPQPLGSDKGFALDQLKGQSASLKRLVDLAEQPYSNGVSSYVIPVGDIARDLTPIVREMADAAWESNREQVESIKAVNVSLGGLSEDIGGLDQTVKKVGESVDSMHGAMVLGQDIMIDRLGKLNISAAELVDILERSLRHHFDLLGESRLTRKILSEILKIVFSQAVEMMNTTRTVEDNTRAVYAVQGEVESLNEVVRGGMRQVLDGMSVSERRRIIEAKGVSDLSVKRNELLDRVVSHLSSVRDALSVPSGLQDSVHKVSMARRCFDQGRVVDAIRFYEQAYDFLADQPSYLEEFSIVLLSEEGSEANALTYLKYALTAYELDHELDRAIYVASLIVELCHLYPGISLSDESIVLNGLLDDKKRRDYKKELSGKISQKSNEIELMRDKLLALRVEMIQLKHVSEQERNAFDSDVKRVVHDPKVGLVGTLFAAVTGVGSMFLETKAERKIQILKSRVLELEQDLALLIGDLEALELEKSRIS